MRRVFSIMVFLLATVAMAFAAESEEHLFRFERSTNKNYLWYDVNQKNGTLNQDTPVIVYWINYAKGHKSDLGWFERKFAFGYKVVKHGANSAVINLNPSSKMPITVCKKDGKWIAICTLNGKNIQMTKMFAQMSGAMKCDYVDIYGIDTATGKPVKERINNK